MENDTQPKQNIGRSILWLVVLAVIIAGGFAITKRKETGKTSNIGSTKTETEDYFSRNQECLKNKNEIATQLGAKDPSFGKASVEQIFYSPKMNSCLYIEFSKLEDSNTAGNSYAMKRLFDVLNNGYSSTPLEMCETYRESFKLVQDSCADFGEKIEEYKK